MNAGTRTAQRITLYVMGRVNLKCWYTFSRIAAHRSRAGSTWGQCSRAGGLDNGSGRRCRRGRRGYAVERSGVERYRDGGRSGVGVECIAVATRAPAMECDPHALQPSGRTRSVPRLNPLANSRAAMRQAARATLAQTPPPKPARTPLRRDPPASSFAVARALTRIVSAVSPSLLPSSAAQLLTVVSGHCVCVLSRVVRTSSRIAAS